MMSFLMKYITTIGVITWLLLQNINSAGSAEISPSDCILLIGGRVFGHTTIEEKPIEYYNPNGECDLTHFPALNFSAQQEIPLYTSGCYFADTQQIVVREDQHHRNASIYDLQEGSIKHIPAAYNSPVDGTTSAPFSPPRCVSCGGYDNTKKTAINSCYEFDVKANKWTNIPPFPNATFGAASVSLGGFYYVMGGQDVSFSASDKLHRYDTTQKEWTTIQSMNSKRAFHSATRLSHEEFITCGGRNNRHSSLISCEVYNNVTQKWRKVGSMNTERLLFALVAFNGQIYAIGGQGKGGGTVEVFNSVNDSWAMVKSFNNAREGFVAFAVTLRPPPTTTPSSTTLTTPTTTPNDKTSNYEAPEAATTTGATTKSSDDFNFQPAWICLIVGGVVIVLLLVVLSGCGVCMYKLYQQLLYPPTCERQHKQEADRDELSGVTIGVDRRTDSERAEDDYQPRILINPAEKADELRRLGNQAAGTSVTINPNEGSDFGDHTEARGGVFDDDDSEAAHTTTGKSIAPTTTGKGTTKQTNTNMTTSTKATNKTEPPTINKNTQKKKSAKEKDKGKEKKKENEKTPDT